MIDRTLYFAPDRCAFYATSYINRNKRLYNQLLRMITPSFVNGEHGFPVIKRNDLTNIFHAQLYEIVGYKYA